jgi:hypothetical protein
MRRCDEINVRKCWPAVPSSLFGGAWFVFDGPGFFIHVCPPPASTLIPPPMRAVLYTVLHCTSFILVLCILFCTRTPILYCTVNRVRILPPMAIYRYLPWRGGGGTYKASLAWPCIGMDHFGSGRGRRTFIQGMNHHQHQHQQHRGKKHGRRRRSPSRTDDTYQAAA